MPFDPYAFELIDWDDEESEEGNLAHCLRHGVNERVVAEVLQEKPVEIRLAVKTAEFAIVGPDRNWSTMWTILFDTSYKRGDWLRPVTGWKATNGQTSAWSQATGLSWSGGR